MIAVAVDGTRRRLRPRFFVGPLSAPGRFFVCLSGCLAVFLGISVPVNVRLPDRGFRMRWSFKIAQVAGIGIFVHWTFFLLLAGLGRLRLFSAGQNDVAAFEGVILVLAIFRLRRAARIGTRSDRASLRRADSRYHAASDRRASPGWRAFPRCPCRSSGSPWPDRPSTW